MDNETNNESVPLDFEDLNNPSELPGIITTLGELKPTSVITEDGVAHLFKRHIASVKRAVQRGELPQPTRLFGSNAWTVGVLIRHIENRLEKAAKEAERKNREISELYP